jgi:hypothetical protein
MQTYQIFRIIGRYPYWPRFVQEVVCYCSCAWAVQLIRGIYHFGISPCAHSGPSKSSFVSGVFIAEELDGVWDWARTATVMYRCSWLSFQHVPEICLYKIWSFLLLKSKLSHFGTTLLNYQIIMISDLSDVGLKAFCCIFCNGGSVFRERQYIIIKYN